MSIVVTSLAKTDEWQMVQRTVGVGESITPVSRRNGVIMDVPADPVEAMAFKTRYPFASFTDPDATQVFVYRQVQVGISGRIKQGVRDAASIASSVFTSYPVETGAESVRDAPPMHFPDGGEFVCCIPRESRLMWERTSRIMEPGDKYVVIDHEVARTRILLARGSLSVNGVLHDKPEVINVNPSDALEALTKVYAAEVWV